MAKRFGTDRTQEEIDEIIKQMELRGYTYGTFREKSMFTNDVTTQRLSMKGAASYLRKEGELGTIN
tara:strand:- start:206 stop:403 length:198 start_codon:yes stop_codon:yes gene_type:complete